MIEENYAKSLSKASKKLYTTDPVVLGHFGPVWELLLNELSQIASYHLEFAQQITHEIEKPMRTPCSEEIHQIQQMDAIIQSIQKKKSVRGSLFKKKSAETTGEWQTDGIDYLNLHQKADQARLNRLKNMVEKFETIQSDQLLKQVQMADKTLLSAKEFDVGHDMLDFCKEKGRGLQTIESASVPRRPRSSTTHSHESSRSVNKLKSVFGRRKKSQDQLSQFDYPNHPITTPVAADTNHIIAPNSIIDVAPPSISRDQSSPAPIVDSEGYSIPSRNTTSYAHAFGSDVSSRESPSDIDSDLQSLSWSQRYQVSIKESAVQEETSQANESFNKMANILRERTPTASRRPRGRRENMPRSQTYSTLFAAGSATNPTQTRSNSMIFLPSSDTNPFIASSSLALSNFNMPSSPSSLSSLRLRTSEASLQLQPIPETQQTQQESSLQALSASTQETIRIVDDKVYVTGQILLSCHDNSLARIPIHINHTSESLELRPCSPLITSGSNDDYLLDTTNLSQDHPTTCFTYEATASLSSLPLQLSASWKCVEGISYLIVKHSKNREIVHTDIKGSVYVVMDDTVTSVQSTPQGIWDISNKRLTWHTRDLLQQYQGEDGPQQRLLAKFYVQQIGTPQPLCFHYLLKNYSISGVSIQSSAIEINQTGNIIQSENL
ncbi:Muniscin C-terminal mu homology domain-containing protein [Choanephora cucurbitarum]|nr:Muniscin C-terminal mu homology domain-containing protein [Choanephora cucurbitarum]